ncbi:hypothetical protein LOTGIDRAFT_232294 [Lottia gigantea]|uniref:CABIT domain-containing protein n=1 Tax=Lottia gigantea TaxID=225164 RepID=V4AC98_LOTGI|nr:hypothetical protein LOTGIDRAFT_232294 [Lottia gigantea]ESO94447.1 hypothetical protein LOTGIDRAFT_232294 [Lottia gigantea]
MATSARYSSKPDHLDEMELRDFVRKYDLPKTVSIAKGSYINGDIRVAQGDILLIRSDFPKCISLSVHDAISKNDIVVSCDCQVKFRVLPPRDTNSESERQSAMYPTIYDLLRDCPTYFQATADFDQPYLPGVSIKSGDTFRFGRIIPSGDHEHVRLECIDEGDKIVRLPGNCRGYFQSLADETTYTLRELVSMAKVSRRLKISSENTKLQLVNNENIEASRGEKPKGSTPYSDTEVKSSGRPSLTGLPLTFKGVMRLNISETTLEVSPWNDLDVRWYIPNDSKISVRLYAPDDYEVPVLAQQKHPSMQLSEFVIRYDQFPIEATLMNCNDIPRDFICYLRNVSDVIVHKVTTLPCLIVKSSKKEYFIVTPNVHVTFADYPRSYRFVFELAECAIGSQVRVMEDVAGDFPAPYSLRYGDVIKITSNKPMAMKKKKGSVPEYKVLSCERLNDHGVFSKLTLPIDLEVQMFELADMSAQKLYKLPDILSKKQGRAPGLVSVMEEDKMNRLPLPPVVEMVQVFQDEVVLVSPLRRTEEGNIEPLVKNCLAIPTRHSLFVSYNKTLDLPKDYFVLPRSKHRKNILVEQISVRKFKELQRRHIQSASYEDIDFGSTDSPIPGMTPSSSLEPMNERRTKRINRSLRRISRLLPNPFNRKSRVENEVPPTISTGDVRAEDNVYTGPPSDDSQYYDDENLYEYVDVNAHRHSRPISTTKTTKPSKPMSPKISQKKPK